MTSKKTSSLLEFTKQVAWSVPVAIAFTDLVANVVRVEGPSMSPTLNPGSISGSESKQCDWILVEKLSYKLWHSYQRGDVATLWCPENPRIQITKRLVAIEGDTVWDDAKGRPEKLLPGRCWIEGDNARLSGDSRNMFGPVHMGLLQGRAVAVVWPLWRCGWLERVEKKGRIVSRAPPTDS